MSGRVTAIFIKPARGEPMRATHSATAETDKGLVGDASHGRSKRQILLIEKETLDAFRLEMGALRENVVVEGIELAGAQKGSVIALGEARVMVTMDCAPCSFVDTIRPGLQDTIRGRRGTLCRVEQGAVFQVGDRVELIGDTAINSRNISSPTP